MNQKAINQATDRLKKATAAGDRLISARSYQDFESAWSDFLLAASGVYSKLEQGSKGHGPSEAWFGRRKHERKGDPLLSYLHHARNADEHGIEPISKFDEGSWAIGGGGHYQLDAKTDLKVTHISGPPPTLTIQPSRVTLVRIKDTRFGDYFDPPTEHLKIPLDDQSPVAVARLALKYLDSMISDAATLCV